jgi:hypothetical protein
MSTPWLDNNRGLTFSQERSAQEHDYTAKTAFFIKEKRETKKNKKSTPEGQKIKVYFTIKKNQDNI